MHVYSCWPDLSRNTEAIPLCTQYFNINLCPQSSLIYTESKEQADTLQP